MEEQYSRKNQQLQNLLNSQRGQSHRQTIGDGVSDPVSVVDQGEHVKRAGEEDNIFDPNEL